MEWKKSFVQGISRRDEIQKNYFLEGPIQFFTNCSQKESNEITFSSTNLFVYMKEDSSPNNSKQKTSYGTQVITSKQIQQELNNLPQLCIQILRTLISILSNNPENKRRFLKENGLLLLKKTLLSIYKQFIPSEVLILLFDFMVDGKLNLNEISLIKNVPILSLLFELFQHMKEPEQIVFFSILNSLCTNQSILNKHICCKHGLIHCCIQLLHKHISSAVSEKVIQFISILGAYTLSVKELKFIFYPLYKAYATGSLTNLSFLLIDSMNYMADNTNLNSFFLFNGRDSGIVLPVFKKWNRSYSFSTWIRVESFQYTNEPRIYSFLDDDGNGVEAFISSTGIIFLKTTVSSEDDKALGFTTFQFVERKWYFITITHSNYRGPFTRDEAKLYIDGQLRQTIYVKYPHQHSFSLSRIGTSGFFASDSQIPHHKNSFFGQMGPSIYLFGEELSAPHIEQLYSLGPRIANLYEDPNETRKLIFSTISKSLIFSYNTNGVHQNSLIDFSPISKEKPILDATLSSVDVSICTHINDALRRVGGSMMILPLFVLLDKPLGEGEGVIDFSIDPRLNRAVLRLLGESLELPSNLGQFVRKYGFENLGSLLQRINPQHLDLESFNVFRKLTKSIKDPEIWDLFFENIFLDFNIWIYTKIQVQKVLWETLLSFAESNVTQFRDFLDVPKLFDTMKTYYWELSEPGSVGFQPMLHPRTKEIIGQRPNAEERKLLRQYIFQIMEVLFRDSQEEIFHIFGFLVSSKDSSLQIEILQYVLTWLKTIPGFSNVCAAIHTHQEVLSLLKNQSEDVRLLAFKFVAFICTQVIHSSSKSKTKQISEFLVAAENLSLFPFTKNTHQVVFDAMFGKLEVLKPSKELEHRASDTAILSPIDRKENETFREKLASSKQSLGKILSRVRKSSVSSGSNPQAQYILINEEGSVPETHSSKHEFLPNSNAVEISVGNVLPAVIRSLHNAEISIQIKVLQSILMLLNSSLFNRNALEQEYGWQNSLFLLLVPSQLQSASLSQIKDLHESVIEIIVTMLDYELKSNKQGWRRVEQMLYFLFLFGVQEPALDIISLGRNIFSSLLNRIKDLLQDSNYYYGINMLQIAFLVEDFAFYIFSENLQIWKSLIEEDKEKEKEKEKEKDLRNSSSAENLVEKRSIHRNSNGDWADLHLVKVLLDLLYQPLPTLSSNTMKLLRKGGTRRLLIKLSTVSIQEAIHAKSPGWQQIVIENSSRLSNFVSQTDTTTIHVDLIIFYKIISALRSHLPLIPDYDSALNLCFQILCKYGIQFVALFKVNYHQVEWFAGISTKEPAFRTSLGNNEQQWDILLGVIQNNYAKISEFEDEEIFQSLKQNYITQFKTIRIQSEKEKQAQLLLRERIEAEMAALIHQFQYHDSTRRQEIQANLYEKHLLVNEAWHSTLNRIQHERSPWGDPKNTIFWKLDSTENYSRMRLKLKRNRHPHDYTNAKRMTGEEDLEIKSHDLNQFLNLGKNVPLPEATSDNEGDESEDWIIIEPEAKHEGKIVTFECKLVDGMDAIPGTFQISSSHLVFDSDESTVPKKYKKVHLSEVREIHFRRHLLRQCAMEFLLIDQKNFFIKFADEETRKKVATIFRSLNFPNLKYVQHRTPAAAFRKSNITKMWQKRLLSNFEYLMQLNTLAGRTYNDLAQYPVFPWIIADYTSEKLDLNSPSTYRDLSKPIGAMNPDRIHEIKERYNDSGGSVPNFHYGEHYSNPGIVLHYLIRMEPFTTYFLKLQGGRFDHADRLFHSFEQSWHSVLTNKNDVRELIPEFYCLPDFLENRNNLDLGVRQDGVRLGDVVLPPWAKTSEEFIYINRQALESDYVSEHLHEWIDLIFGYKQNGRNAVEALNVFYYVTYEGAVDLDSIKSETEKLAITTQINEFGQTPSQLTHKPHPSRDSINPKEIQIEKSIFLRPNLFPKTPYFIQINEFSLVFLQETSTSVVGHGSSKIITVDSELHCCVHQWLPGIQSREGAPFAFEPDPIIQSRRKLERLISTSFKSFALTHDEKVLISCNYADNSFRLILAATGKIFQSVTYHSDVVTCVELTSDGKYLITGSKDTTIMVWKISSNHKVDEIPVHILWGHDEEIISVQSNVELDVVVSTSKGTSIIVHTLRSGKYVRSIFHPQGLPFDLINISSVGTLVSFCDADSTIRTYSINGKLLCSHVTRDEEGIIAQMRITSDNEFLISGGSGKKVVVRKLFNLQLVHKFEYRSQVCSIALTGNEHHLLVGLKDGKLLIETPEVPSKEPLPVVNTEEENKT